MIWRHRIVMLLATLGIWFGLMRWIGSVPFTPWMTDLLVRTTGLVGIYGVEAVEDSFFLLAACISLVAAILIVVGATWLIRKRSAS